MFQYPQAVLSLLMLSCFVCRPSLRNGDNDTVKCLDRERKALLQFKDGITIHDSCGLLDTWRDDTDCCHWHGIHCSNDTGHVIMLHLPGSNRANRCLAGKLSPSLGGLKHLRHLNLSFNDFSQPIPNFLGSLVNLEYLSLEYAFVYNGEISPHKHSLQWLSRLSFLRYLDLSGADLSGAGNWTQIASQLPFLSVLRMDECRLPGRIPLSFSHTNSSSNLRVISLSHNFINYSSSMFQWLLNLPQITAQLEYLDLSFNQLGHIPNAFGNLVQVSHLDLSFNQIGHIPNRFRNLKHLSHLDLSFNQLSHIPNGFGNLQYLDLSYNRLKGPISIDLENLQHLSHLDLSYNHLEGPILSGFGNLHHLVHLDLSHNNLEGPIPSEFQNMHSISYLSLSDNHLQGSIYKILTRLCNLKSLYLGNNSFFDELTYVTRALLTCKNATLQRLDLSQNCFSGGIPDSISSFPLLKELYLDGNQLTGNITQSIGQLGMLEKLYLSSNTLEDTLTHTLFLNLTNLKELSLSDLVMNIDASWEPPFQLDVISLRSCTLGPYYPNWLQTQTQTRFSYLDVSNAKISDSLPASFWNSVSYDLSYLNMSNNRFYGLIPNSVDIFASEVDLSLNLFEGAIPLGFTNVSISLYLNDNRFSDYSQILCHKEISLSELDLSNNMLSGELPDCWMNLGHLRSLHLENNRFSGSIPKSIGTLKNLKYLDLHNNSFSGAIPDSLENCTSLSILNLGYNSFNGNIPPWIGNIQNLGALILRGNDFLGEIPPSMCQLPQLQILDIAMNHISGVIPRCIYNFTAMMGGTDFELLFYPHRSKYFGHKTNLGRIETATVRWKREEQKFKQSVSFVRFIDFSFNELGGEIPDGIFDLTGLESLELSKNNLNGSISSEIGKLTALELLDLSENRLTGEIPSSLAKLSFLAILSLSDNSLSGKIPIGTQLQSFNASSYTGNPRLCGAPLSTCPEDQKPVDMSNWGNTSVHDDHYDNGLFPGLYISVVLGLIIGFWGVFGTLIIKQSWRYTWFRVLDSIRDRLYVFTMTVVAKAWRKP